MRVLFTIFFIFILVSCYGQAKKQIRQLDSLFYSTKLDSLKQHYAAQKMLIEDYELITLLALSYYPEINDVKIQFKEARIKTTLNARPTLLSLIFRKKNHRKYIIRINKQMNDSIINIKSVPFNAKIGLLGHEFAHILDYHQRNFFQVMNRLFSYFSKKKKSSFEKEIDIMTIRKGLGWQLFDWSKYVLQESNAKAKYKVFKKEVYLTPEQIESYIIKWP